MPFLASAINRLSIDHSVHPRIWAGFALSRVEVMPTPGAAHLDHPVPRRHSALPGSHIGHDQLGRADLPRSARRSCRMAKYARGIGPRPSAPTAIGGVKVMSSPGLL